MYEFIVVGYEVPNGFNLTLKRTNFWISVQLTQIFEEIELDEKNKVQHTLTDRTLWCAAPFRTTTAFCTNIAATLSLSN